MEECLGNWWENVYLSYFSTRFLVGGHLKGRDGDKDYSCMMNNREYWGDEMNTKEIRDVAPLFQSSDASVWGNYAFKLNSI